MNKKEWFYAVFLPLIGTWGIDQITKLWAAGIKGIEFYGFLGLVNHHNHGAILGLFSDLPPILRVVSLSTGGAFLIFSFFVIQWLLPAPLKLLRAGTAILLGGILGNVTDRILNGYVLDFIVLGSPKYLSPAFNLADALQWVGYSFIIYTLVREGDKLWPEVNNRKSYWINPRFQIRYCTMLLACGIGFAIVSGTYAYTFLRVTIVDLAGQNEAIQNRFLFPFTMTFVIVTMSFLIVLFFVGLMISHRAAGPVYAFEKFLDNVLMGKRNPLRFRSGDEFTHLEELADRVLDYTEPLLKDEETQKISSEELNEDTKSS